MAVCLNCGQEINVLNRECPKCHAPIKMDSIAMPKKSELLNEVDVKKYFIISAIVPILGLYYYFKYKEKSTLIGFMFNTIFLLCFIIVVILIKKMF